MVHDTGKTIPIPGSQNKDSDHMREQKSDMIRILMLTSRYWYRLFSIEYHPISYWNVQQKNNMIPKPRALHLIVIKNIF